MKEILSPEIMEWIKDNQWHDGMKETLATSSDAEDKARRRISIRLAVQWYQAYINGEDGRNIPLPLQETLRKYVAKENQEETIDDQVEMMWAKMCTNAAQYTYAKLQPADNFTKALIVSYLALLPDDVGIEAIHTPMRKALIKGLKKNDSADKNHYGVQITGLISSIVFPVSDGIIPPNAHVWLAV